MALPWAERKRLATLLKESRPLTERIAGSERKPIPTAPPSVIDREIQRLEKEKEFRRLSKMDAESRRLLVLKELRDRTPEQPKPPHPRIEKIEAILDRIVQDPAREFHEFEFGQLVLAQHAEGMDEAEADRLWKALQQQEAGYLSSKRQAAIEKQTALINELRQLDIDLGEVADVAPPNSFFVLHRVIPTHGYDLGVRLTPQEFQEIEAAAGDESAESAVVQKHLDKVNTYLAAVEAENAGGS